MGLSDGSASLNRSDAFCFRADMAEQERLRPGFRKLTKKKTVLWEHKRLRKFKLRTSDPYVGASSADLTVRRSLPSGASERRTHRTRTLLTSHLT